jgi:hypothetical protein
VWLGQILGAIQLPAQAKKKQSTDNDAIDNDKEATPETKKQKRTERKLDEFTISHIPSAVIRSAWKTGAIQSQKTW